MAQTVKQQQNLPTISEVLMSKGAFVEHGDTHHNVDDDFEPVTLSSLIRQFSDRIVQPNLLTLSNGN